MLTMTDVLRHVEAELGASHRLIDLAGEEMARAVVERTLPTYSLYFPHLLMHVVQEKEDRVDKAITGRYYIKADGWILLGIARMVTDSINRGTSGGGWPLYGVYNDPFDRQISADARSFVEEPLTWRWFPPNVVEINQKWLFGGNINFELKVRHAEDLHTIPETMRDEFLALAEADIKSALYAIRSQFSSMGTPFGTIELNLDDLREGRQLRKDIEQKWRQQFPKQANRRKIWVG